MPPSEPLNKIIRRLGRIKALQASHLFDAYLHPVALDSIASRYFPIPVTVSWPLMNLIHQAVTSRWHRRYPALWHTILTSCRLAKLRHNKSCFRFSVRLDGLSTQPYWQLQATAKRDEVGTPYLFLTLVDRRVPPLPFDLGHTIMTQGAAALKIHFCLYLTRHLQAQQQRQKHPKQASKTAVHPHTRIHSTYTIQTQATTTQIYIITKATATATAILLPSEYK